MKPNRLPEEYLEVNGFRRARGNDSYVEWKNHESGRTARVWAEFGARGPPVIDVHYEVKEWRGGIVDQGTVTTVDRRKAGASGMWREAIEAAARWMRNYEDGSGRPSELDFS